MKGGSYKLLLVAGAIVLGFALAIFSQGETTPAAPTTSVPTVAPTKQISYPTETIGVHDPSFDEMIAFLNSNKVNWQGYRENYDCLQFACDLQRESFEQGIRSAVVLIDFSTNGHVIVAFETTDKGLIYIEPQSDLPIRFEIGAKYWKWVAGPDYAIDYDDTVTKITLKWDLSFCGSLRDLSIVLAN